MNRKYTIGAILAFVCVLSYFVYVIYWFVKTIPWVIAISVTPEQYLPPTEYGTLTPEHFDVMKKFWNYVNALPDVEEYPANTAYVLPRDYGYGFRGPDDKIWGLWEADPLSPLLWNDLNNLLATYGSYLDAVYETKIGDAPINLPYDKLIFWNGTIIEK